MLTDIAVTSMVVAFVLSYAETMWRPLGPWRAPAALIVAAGAMWGLGISPAHTVFFILTLAAGYAGAILHTAVEHILNQPTPLRQTRNVRRL